MRVSFAGNTLRVTLDCGDDENRMSQAMMTWLSAVLDRPPASVDVLHLSAVGPAFCRGPVPAGSPGAVRGLGETIKGLNRSLARTSLVTVAEVDGVAAGFGVGLACLPDISYAGDRASFVFPEVIHDLSPALVLSWLSEYVGPKAATLLTLTGAPVDASRAFQLGLVSRSVASSELRAEVDGLLAHLSTLHRSTVQEIKRFIQDRRGLSLSAAEELAVGRMGDWAERGSHS